MSPRHVVGAEVGVTALQADKEHEPLVQTRLFRFKAEIVPENVVNRRAD